MLLTGQCAPCLLRLYVQCTLSLQLINLAGRVLRAWAHLADDMFARASSLPNGSTIPTPGAPADVFGSASPLPAFGGPSPSSAMDIDKELQDMSGPLQQSPHESFELLENPTGAASFACASLLPQTLQAK